MALPALNIPVVGNLESLKGFDDVKQEVGVQDTGGGTGGGGGGGGAGGGMLTSLLGMEAGSDIITGAGGGGLLGGMSSKMGSLVGIGSAILGSLAVLEPFRKIGGMILGFLEGVLWPVAKGYLLLMGVILKTWPAIADFIKNPVDNLMDLAVEFGSWVWNGLQWVGDKISGLVSDFVAGIGDFFSPVTSTLKSIWKGVKNVFGLNDKAKSKKRTDMAGNVDNQGNLYLGQGQYMVDGEVVTKGQSMSYSPTFNMTMPTRDSMEDIIYLEQRNRQKAFRDMKNVKGGN